MKNLLCLLLVLMLPCVGMAEPAAELAGLEWDRDAKNHWHVLENGEKADLAPHVMQDVFCEVCGSEIWLLDDGWADVSNYNDYGELARSTSYDDTGAVSHDCVFVYGYDENGVKLWEKQYENGRYVGEAVYGVNAEGENHPVWSAAYYDDGTSARNEYDAYGNVIKAYTYDAEGHVDSETTSEYVQDADGWFYEARNVVVMDGITFILEYNQYGDWTYSSIIEADGTLVSDTTFEYVYQDGVKVSGRQYSFGEITVESYYNEMGVLVKEIEYMEDGSAEVYEFDEEGNLIHH